jgi:2-methylisocitrate lyase-like PEP mutase family enzyme
MRKPLFVVNARTDGEHRRGQQQMVAAGAVALAPERMPNSAEFVRLMDEYIPPPVESQVSLFGEEPPCE